MSRTADHIPATRRDLIAVTSGALIAVGGALALWPFIAHLAPGPGSRDRDTVDVDLRPVRAGQMITVTWRGQPVIVRSRTTEEIARARGGDVARLRDRLARSAGRAQTAWASDENRTVAGHEQWLVVIGLCPHLGCRLVDGAGDGVGYFCPCHAAEFDHSGRVVGGPAATNLPVPPYHFIDADRIRIGAGRG